MFKSTDTELEKMGALTTTREIQRQPELWKEVFSNYKEKKENIEKFLNKVKLESDTSKIRVVFTGAGTSQYVGDTITPYLNKKGDVDKFTFESIATTDIVASPMDYLRRNETTILVSFARSGNSPESVAAVERAEKIIKNLFQITITCAPEGKLAQKAQKEDDNLLLLQPELSNDKGFAMTGSFTCMVLTALLVFDQSEIAYKKNWVSQIIKMGNQVIDDEKKIQEITDLDFERITYLGSGSLSGLTREAQLKVLELTAGKFATMYDSSMGFRHGPKSFIDNKTLVFSFINNNKYTRQYDIDILEEMKNDRIAKKIIAIGISNDKNYSGYNYMFNEVLSELPEAYMALPDIMFGQTFALQCSLKVNNTPDTPSATGTVNRVVKGVVLHEFTD